MTLQDRIIYQLVDSRSFGGIESHILNLSRWLRGNGYFVEVLFLNDYGPHPLKAQLTESNILWRCANRHRGLSQILKQNPCVLATHGYKAGIIGRIVARFCHVPVVSTYHSGDPGKGRVWCYNKLDELTASLADQVVSVSTEISARLHVTSHQLPNFVDPPKTPNIGGKEVAFVGRLSEEKGPDTFAQLTETFAKKATFSVYGDGPMRRSLALRYPHLCFHGQVDMADHWQDIDLLCITSRREGMPLVALEAMARGIPVLSFNIGALDQLILDDQNGWLVQPGDHALYQQQLERWLHFNDMEKSRFSLAATRQVCDNYCCDVVLPRLLSIYRRAVHLQAAHKSGRKPELL